jgi:LPXTG-motif cell wall-anchored protein
VGDSAEADSRAAAPAETEPTAQTEPAAPSQQQEPTAPEARTADAAPMAAPGETVPPVAVYALSANTELTTQLTPISTATGGKALPLESPDDVTQSIMDTVEDAATAPTANLTTADTVIVNNETVLSGLGSTYTGDEATFAFDFDNDGTIDETTTEGAATHKYPTAGTAEARLVVTDSRGRTSEATTSIEVRTVDSLQTAVPVTSTTPTTPPSTTPSSTQPNSDTDESDLASTGVSGLPLLVTIGLLLLIGGAGVLIVARRRRSRAH